LRRDVLPGVRDVVRYHRDRGLAHSLQRDLLGVRAPAHPAHYVVRRGAIRGGLGRLSARMAAPQAVSMAAPSAAGPAVRAGIPQRVRRALPNHPGDARPRREDAAADQGKAVMTTAATLLSDVLPGAVRMLAAAEMYTDPPELAPLPEEEPLIAKSVAKRRNEFITVRHCARQALRQLGVPPVPILKGEKG